MNHSYIRVSLTSLKATVASQLSHRICNDFFSEQFFHFGFLQSQYPTSYFELLFSESFL